MIVAGVLQDPSGRERFESRSTAEAREASGPCVRPTFFRSADRGLHEPAELTPEPTKHEPRKRRASERPRVGCCEELGAGPAARDVETLAWFSAAPFCREDSTRANEQLSSLTATSSMLYI